MRAVFNQVQRQCHLVCSRRRLTVVLAGVLATATGILVSEARAQTVAVAGDAIKELVVGKTVDLDTPLRSPISITYKDNGSMSATAGAALSLYLGASSDRGRWWVENGRLCQKFFKWLEAETSCLRLRQDGRRIAWTRDDGRTGTATIMANGPMRAQPAYGLGGSGLVAASPPTTTPTHVAPAQVVVQHADRTPTIEVPAPRPVLASLTPATALVAPSLAPRIAPASPPLSSSLPHDWLAEPDQGINIRAMIAHTRKAHALNRWCHEVRDFRLLMRPQAVDAEAPELMTAARHLNAPDTSDVPAASCLVPSPAMQDVARQLAGTN